MAHPKYGKKVTQEESLHLYQIGNTVNVTVQSSTDVSLSVVLP
jgi:hypothetical protein